MNLNCAKYKKWWVGNIFFRECVVVLEFICTFGAEYDYL